MGSGSRARLGEQVPQCPMGHLASWCGGCTQMRVVTAAGRGAWPCPSPVKCTGQEEQC